MIIRTKCFFTFIRVMSALWRTSWQKGNVNPAPADGRKISWHCPFNQRCMYVTAGLNRTWSLKACWSGDTPRSSICTAHSWTRGIWRGPRYTPTATITGGLSGVKKLLELSKVDGIFQSWDWEKPWLWPELISPHSPWTILLKFLR